MSILEVKNLKKVFKNGKKIYIKNLTLKKGFVYGFVGKNGAGKTTTLKMLTGIIKPTSGEIIYFNKPYLFGKSSPPYTSYLPDVPQFYDYMNAKQYLKLCTSFKNSTGNESYRKISDILKLVGLKDEKNRIKTYSRGMKQRLGMAVALIDNPKILFLDEPTSALDPVGRFEVMSIIDRLRNNGITIVFSTHILSDVQKISDEIIVIDKGILKEDKFTEKIKKSRKLFIKLQFINDTRTLYNILKNIEDEDNSINMKNDIINVISNNYNKWIYIIQNIIVKNNFLLKEFRFKSLTLEEFFLRR